MHDPALEEGQMIKRPGTPHTQVPAGQWPLPEFETRCESAGEALAEERMRPEAEPGGTKDQTSSP